MTLLPLAGLSHSEQAGCGDFAVAAAVAETNLPPLDGRAQDPFHYVIGRLRHCRPREAVLNVAARIRLSVNSIRNNLVRLASSESRMATSRWRAAARDNSSVVTLAHMRSAGAT